jgi:hypothetical protein
VGRFHERYPLTAKNPTTNTRIIDEVYFYLIRNRSLVRIIEVQQQA